MRCNTDRAVDFPVLKEALDDSKVLFQMAQGSSEIDAQLAFHHLSVAGPEPKAEAPGCDMTRYLGFLGDAHRVAQPCLDDGRSQKNALGLSGGRGQQREGIAQTGGWGPHGGYIQILRFTNGRKRPGWDGRRGHGVWSQALNQALQVATDRDSDGPVAHTDRLL